MLNRLKRRPLFVAFFLIQFILFSTYSYVFYQNGNSGDRSIDADDTKLSGKIDHLPANIIEKGPRNLIQNNYRKIRAGRFNLFNDNQNYQKMKSMNISLVEEINEHEKLVFCPLLPNNLIGRVDADLFSYSMNEVEENYSNSTIQLGGHWFPSDCTARSRVAIIIPYRDREMQLRIFLNFMHSFLQKQKLDYQIFLVEPVRDITFNRALLFNIGFRQSLQHYPWQCFVFHDVDLIPEDDRNIYSCPPEPRHLSVAVNTMNYKLPYRTIFGGVSALTVDQFESINGFSNQYFGWGGEDDDMAARILTKYRISRYPMSIGRYKMLRHRPDKPNNSRYKILSLSSDIRLIDGLSNLQYNVVETQKKKLYTRILVTYNETLISSSVDHIKKKKKKNVFRS